MVAIFDRISSCSYYIANLRIVPTLFQEKISHFAVPCIRGCSSLYCLGYGSKELYVDVGNPLSQNRVSHPSISRKDKCCFLAHALLFLGTGICTGAQTLQDCALINLGKLYAPLGYVGSGMFLFACLIGLEQNISQYHRANEMIPDSLEERNKASELKTSAILGIINNFGYIMAIAIALLGMPAGIALTIGCIAACTGGLKVLYDFYFFYLENKQIKQT